MLYLTTFKGRSITYDAVGNPLSYYNGTQYSFVWTGRSLTGATIGTNEYTFTYNDAGIRTSKTKNGVTTTYYLNGSQILGEETNGNITVYLYDAEGTPIGMQYHGATYAENVWDVFWYEKNIQGDIVAVYNQAGTKLISYTYDAWGNFITTYHNGTSPSSIAAKNPFTYRGYYYDSDLGLYCVGVRYYDSITGRWISPESNVYAGLFDISSSILGYGVYVYCLNNPVNKYDPTGQSTKSLDFGFSVVLVGGVSYTLSFVTDDDQNFGIQITESNILKKHSGSVFGLAAFSFGYSISKSNNADTIRDLEGISTSFTVSGKNDITVSSSDFGNINESVIVVSEGKSITGGFNPVSASIGTTKTLFSFNLAKTYQKIKTKCRNAWSEVCSWFE